MKKRTAVSIICSVLFLFIVFCFSSCEIAPSSTKPEPDEAFFAGNVFQIIVKDLGEQPIATGTGFVINQEGWFITNAHVVEDAYYAQAIFNIPNSETGDSFTYLDINYGTYYNSDKDIYIGKIENYDSIQDFYQEIAINTTYKINDTTYSVGYPNSSTDLVIKKGKVTEKWSDLYEKLYSGNSYICSSSYIAHGSSGGILVNDNLEVIGITTYGWEDENENFISGASISAFNFDTIIRNGENTKSSNLISFQKRFHEQEELYIKVFNDAYKDAEEGSAKKEILSDGSVACIYTYEGESADSDYVYTETLTICSDFWVRSSHEWFWDTGGRSTMSLYGYYDNTRGIADFSFYFKWEWKDGSYYTVESSHINYSPNVALTLNRYEVTHSNSIVVTDDNINYAKNVFNSLYEYLTQAVLVDE